MYVSEFLLWDCRHEAHVDLLARLRSALSWWAVVSISIDGGTPWQAFFHFGVLLTLVFQWSFNQELNCRFCDKESAACLALLRLKSWAGLPPHLPHMFVQVAGSSSIFSSYFLNIIYIYIYTLAVWDHFWNGPGPKTVFWDERPERRL